MRSSLFAVVAVAILLSACGQPKAAPSGQIPTQNQSAVATANSPSPTDTVAHDPTILATSRTTPEAFVRSLYATYGSHAEDAPQINNRTFYSARTRALIAENERLYEGYAGYPDADPICDCQDWGDPLRVTEVAVIQTDSLHAIARPILTNSDKHTQAFLLVREDGGWRIDDITGLSGGPLVAGLMASNADARAHPVAEQIAAQKAAERTVKR